MAKSFLPRLIIQNAQREHGCQFNQKHRIVMGQVRLHWKNGRDEANYCVPCALTFLREDMAKLQGIIADLEAIAAKTEPRI
ncbi:MAG TPA: hypothetical protein VIY69_07760 [Candidatus Acidoferrales bacterium]